VREIGGRVYTRAAVEGGGRSDDLIFDVGLHRGEDSAYYLSKGYRVVAFEANPGLIAHCRKRFEPELAEGRMTIVEGAIDDRGRETVPFFVHDTETVWGTTDEAWAARNAPRGVSSRIEVEAVDFGQALREYGIPYYLKVDIEGADRICLDAVGDRSERPRFVSIESEKVDPGELVSELRRLAALGYARFAVCQQDGMAGRTITTTTRDGRPLTYAFEQDASGPFGEDVPEPWTDMAGALARYRTIFREYRVFGDGSPFDRRKPARAVRRALSMALGRPLPGWYDTHARLDA
jgi:FkbM family methyltransferase